VFPTFPVAVPRVLAVIATLLVRWCCDAVLFRMVPEVYQLFWATMARAEFITDAAVEAGTYRKQGARWLVAAGGVRPRRDRGLKGRCLTLAQREEIALGRARGQSVRSIAAAIGRSRSTVSRELRRNARSAACACVASNHYSFAATSSGRLPLVEVADVEPRRLEAAPRVRTPPKPPVASDLSRNPDAVEPDWLSDAVYRPVHSVSASASCSGIASSNGSTLCSPSSWDSQRDGTRNRP
jgi:hypothetical protein